MEAYEKASVQFIVSVRKTSRLVEERGWSKAYRFIALRYQKKLKPQSQEGPEQYQLFDTPEYGYRVFVTNVRTPVTLPTWFYNQRAGAENLIKEANNDAGLSAHPSARWAMNCIHFQTGHVGLQPELLADAVQSRGRIQSRCAQAHDAGHRTRGHGTAKPGEFAAIQREWKTGDDNPVPHFLREQLLSAKRVSGREWLVDWPGVLPFTSLGELPYTMYVKVS